MSPLKRSNGCITFYLIFSLFAGASGCAKKEVSLLPEPAKETIPADKILARVGDEIITIDDYQKEFALLPPEYRDVQDLHKSQFLEILINKHLLLAEAERRGLEDSENVKRLFQRVKEEIMIQELIDRQIGDKVEVTDNDIEENYNQNKENYVEPARIRASHILVDSESSAKDVLSELNHGADFADLAKKYSFDAPTKEKGGDLGYFTKGALLPDFEKACDELEIGETSGVVKTELGYHIIKVFDRKDQQPLTLDEVRDGIKRELQVAKEISLYENMLQDLRKNRVISINEELLEKTVPLAPAQTN